MDVEKRLHPRIATHVEMTFKDSGSFIRSYMLNVSNGGIFIKTDHPLPLDALLSMRFSLPDDQEKMEIEGKVVWTNKTSKVFPVGMGIQFTKIAPEHQEKIKVFIKAHQKELQSRSFL